MQVGFGGGGLHELYRALWALPSMEHTSVTMQYIDLSMCWSWCAIDGPPSALDGGSVEARD